MPTIFKRSNGVYYVSFWENGRRKWKSTGRRTKAAALEIASEIETIRTTKKSAVKLQTFIRDFLSHAEATFAPKTVVIYRAALERLADMCGNRSLSSISPFDVDRFRALELKRISPVSANIELRTLRAAFYTAQRWRLIPENPFRRVPLAKVPDKEPVYFTREDFDKLLAVLPERWFRDLILVAVCTGMRQGEILNLSWNQVDLGSRLISVRSSVEFRTKMGKRRVVPMNELVFGILIRRARESQNGQVFMNGDGSLQGSWVSHLFKKRVLAAGLRSELHFHSLRHTFATWLVREGVSIYEIQKLLGHSNIAVTQIYSHVGTAELQKAVEKLDFDQGNSHV